MKSVALLTLLSLAPGAAPLLRAEGGFAPSYTPASYYGDNDLVDYYQANKVMRKYAESTVALFPDSAIPMDEGSGEYKLRDINLRGKFNLREGEAFGDQPVGAYCSGVLVAEDLILTAGHCLRPDPRGGPCERIKVVFGYAVKGAREAPSSFPSGDVYSCKQVIRQEVHDEYRNISCRDGVCRQGSPSDNGPDFALIRLDRKVEGRYPLPVSRTAVKAGAQVGAIGHPSGLPVKIQEKGAAVRTVAGNGYFVANLDTFGGNSGSPVFNLETYRIEGILARGGVDYVYAVPGSTSTVEDPPQPYGFAPGRANYYPQDGGRGEDVTSSSEFQSLIPRGEMERFMDEAAGQRERRQGAPGTAPAIYFPGRQGEPRTQPAIYYPPEPAAPEPVII